MMLCHSVIETSLTAITPDTVLSSQWVAILCDMKIKWLDQPLDQCCDIVAGLVVKVAMEPLKDKIGQLLFPMEVTIATVCDF